MEIAELRVLEETNSRQRLANFCDLMGKTLLGNFHRGCVNLETRLIKSGLEMRTTMQSKLLATGAH